MANLIILEGIERCGKGTIQEYLQRDGYGRAIIAKTKQPDNVDFADLGILYEGCHQFGLSIYSAFKGETFIIDRYFLSEFVYARHFNRKTCMHINYVKELIKENNVTVFYLKNEHYDYVNRGPKNKVKLTSADYLNMQALFDSWIDVLDRYVPELKIVPIETSDRDIEKIYKEIKTHLIK